MTASVVRVVFFVEGILLIGVFQRRLFRQQVAMLKTEFGLKSNSLSIAAYKKVDAATLGDEGLQVLFCGPDWDRRTCTRFFQQIQVLEFLLLSWNSVLVFVLKMSRQMILSSGPMEPCQCFHSFDWAAGELAFRFHWHKLELEVATEAATPNPKSG